MTAKKKPVAKKRDAAPSLKTAFEIAKEKYPKEPTHRHGNADDPEYDAFLGRVKRRFIANTMNGSAPVFESIVNGDALWNDYLSNMPAAKRQFHNCHACRHFIRHYGNLVVVDDYGVARSAIWHEEDAPKAYKKAIRAMRMRLNDSVIKRQFLSIYGHWGTEHTPPWRHFALIPPYALLYKPRPLLSAGQAMAAKQEGFKNVIYALEHWTLDSLVKAVGLLETESLYRSEKCLGVATWLRDAKRLSEDLRSRRKHFRNSLWMKVAQAPEGFLHPKASMIGTLLDDLNAGLPYFEVQERFAKKMHPLSYQRPQAAPKAGNVAQANRIFEKLQATGALRRRFARMDDLKTVWRRNEGYGPLPTPDRGGPFSGLDAFVPGRSMTYETSSQPKHITWALFQNLLPSVRRIEYRTTRERVAYGVFTTASLWSAPPILQWDNINRRNPVGWYTWVGGSMPEDYSLKQGHFYDVLGIVDRPSNWDNYDTHYGKAMVLVLDGARETKQGGLALFPETLKTEFHGIRKSIEAYSNLHQLEGLNNSTHAAGPMLTKGFNWQCVIRVTFVSGVVKTYELGRWE